MMTFARKDSYVVCIDTNREFECDGLYVEGMDYFRLCDHTGMEKHWRTELEQQGRDYAIAIRAAHIMQRLGRGTCTLKEGHPGGAVLYQSAAGRVF